ncbi:hypothetical protein BKA66DRAFT_412353 [Pyrenochaeta sp. MPI-SDFR-AT-0127]|nr:hypothetical protein BKA66DRAFT_412353 [Pyrenochaeta sp. MPI-SDFR-AT-0127]
MNPTPQHLEAFAPLQWAAPYLTSPNWVAHERTRGAGPGEATDVFCRDTMRAHDGVQEWLELYEKPASGNNVTKSLSLCKFGLGLNGFPGIAHGGAILTIMDEALAYFMVANETLASGVDFTKLGEETWKQLLADGRPPQEVLKGRFVTAKLDVKFLRPVLCPGVVGIEVEVLEKQGHKMKMRGIMKDEKGLPLIQVDGLWVKMGGTPKL